MNCTENVDVVLAIGRVSVLLFGLGTGALSIYLGWRLCQSKVISDTSTEIMWKSWRVALTAGPGIFLAVFGAAIVAWIVSQQLDLSTQQSIQSTVSITPRTQGRLLLVQNDAVPIPQNCIIRSRTRRLYDGDTTGPKAEDIKEALDRSVATLSREQKATRDDWEARRLRKMITTLEHLKGGVIE
ncbi:MAG: hypothetical protein Q8K71_17455 [Polaromonas sp.]|nr:hypothetical protein [Polaromonas sp.]MDP3752125.1 hypothetical protein [Polaromonas sp.]